MSVIAIHSTALLTRRIRELQRRRQSLLARQERLRHELPDWAVEPLRLVGLSAEEIRGLVADLSEVEREVGLDDNDRRLDDLDREIEQLEDLLLSAPSNSLDGIESVMSLGVARLREFVVTDPADVLYDHGEARLLALFERVLGDLQNLLRRKRLDAV
jgi:hypothetical protein